MKSTEIEGNVKFNKWDTEQAKQLYEIVKKIRELKHSKTLRDTEKRLLNDLQELEKYADGQPARFYAPKSFAIACCKWYHRVHGGTYTVSWPDPT
jgi:hypothetical protein